MCKDLTWNLWFWCGFNAAASNGNRITDDRLDIAEGHVRLAPYGFMRLEEGSGIAHLSASNNARICIPQKGGTCPKIKESLVKETTE